MLVCLRKYYLTTRNRNMGLKITMHVAGNSHLLVH